MRFTRLFTLSAMALAASGAFAQASSVTLYGIVDAAIRVETNRGPASDPNLSLKSVIPGGMSQSRLGINVNEDMGGGWRALVNMEHRLRSDDGGQASADFWRQAWVGLLTPYGRVTVGRQYNVLFDVTTSSFASYKYSPYIEAFKPEIGVAMSARQSNMVKYAVTQGGLTGELQVSAGEGNSIDKSMGGMVRYAQGAWAVGIGALNTEDPTGKKAKGIVGGIGYTSGPLYANVKYGRTRFDAGISGPLRVLYSSALGSATDPASSVFNPLALDVNTRSAYSFGFTYQLTPQFNLGAQYYAYQQTHYTPALAGRTSKVNLFSIVGDYALSKRTDAYVELDSTKFASDSVVTFINGARSRLGYMAGVRHRF